MPSNDLPPELLFNIINHLGGNWTASPITQERIDRLFVTCSGAVSLAEEGRGGDRRVEDEEEDSDGNHIPQDLLQNNSQIATFMQTMAFRALSLVHRAFTPFCQSMLFRHLVIDNETTVDDLYRLHFVLSKNDELRTYIKEVTVQIRIWSYYIPPETREEHAGTHTCTAYSLDENAECNVGLELLSLLAGPTCNIEKFSLSFQEQYRSQWSNSPPKYETRRIYNRSAVKLARGRGTQPSPIIIADARRFLLQIMEKRTLRGLTLQGLSFPQNFFQRDLRNPALCDLHLHLPIFTDEGDGEDENPIDISNTVQPTHLSLTAAHRKSHVLRSFLLRSDPGGLHLKKIQSLSVEVSGGQFQVPGIDMPHTSIFCSSATLRVLPSLNSLNINSMDHVPVNPEDLRGLYQLSHLNLSVSNSSTGGWDSQCQLIHHHNKLLQVLPGLKTVLLKITTEYRSIASVLDLFTRTPDEKEKIFPRRESEEDLELVSAGSNLPLLRSLLLVLEISTATGSDLQWNGVMPARRPIDLKLITGRFRDAFEVGNNRGVLDVHIMLK